MELKLTWADPFFFGKVYLASMLHFQLRSVSYKGLREPFRKDFNNGKENLEQNLGCPKCWRLVLQIEEVDSHCFGPLSKALGKAYRPNRG